MNARIVRCSRFWLLVEVIKKSFKVSKSQAKLYSAKKV